MKYCYYAALITGFVSIGACAQDYNFSGNLSLFSTIYGTGGALQIPVSADTTKFLQAKVIIKKTVLRIKA